jgi:tRNA (guanine10-N2)-methyltransferase
MIGGTRPRPPQWKIELLGPVEAKTGLYPNTIPYALASVMHDLLQFAAEYLVLGGRLLYWLPTTTEYQFDDLPTQPCMSSIGDIEQAFGVWSRRLIVMEKTSSFDKSKVNTIVDENVAHSAFRDKYFNITALS